MWLQQNIAKLYREHLRGKLHQWEKKIGKKKNKFQ